MSKGGKAIGTHPNSGTSSLWGGPRRSGVQSRVSCQGQFHLRDAAYGHKKKNTIPPPTRRRHAMKVTGKQMEKGERGLIWKDGQWLEGGA